MRVASRSKEVCDHSKPKAHKTPKNRIERNLSRATRDGVVKVAEERFELVPKTSRRLKGKAYLELRVENLPAMSRIQKSHFFSEIVSKPLEHATMLTLPLQTTEVLQSFFSIAPEKVLSISMRGLSNISPREASIIINSHNIHSISQWAREADNPRILLSLAKGFNYRGKKREKTIHKERLLSAFLLNLSPDNYHAFIPLLSRSNLEHVLEIDNPNIKEYIVANFEVFSHCNPATLIDLIISTFVEKGEEAARSLVLTLHLEHLHTVVAQVETEHYIPLLASLLPEVYIKYCLPEYASSSSSDTFFRELKGLDNSYKRVLFANGFFASIFASHIQELEVYGKEDKPCLKDFYRFLHPECYPITLETATASQLAFLASGLGEEQMRILLNHLSLEQIESMIPYFKRDRLKFFVSAMLPHEFMACCSLFKEDDYKFIIGILTGDKKREVCRVIGESLENMLAAEDLLDDDAAILSLMIYSLEGDNILNLASYFRDLKKVELKRLWFSLLSTEQVFALLKAKQRPLAISSETLDLFRWRRSNSIADKDEFRLFFEMLAIAFERRQALLEAELVPLDNELEALVTEIKTTEEASEEDKRVWFEKEQELNRRFIALCDTSNLDQHLSSMLTFFTEHGLVKSKFFRSYKITPESVLDAQRSFQQLQRNLKESFSFLTTAYPGKLELQIKSRERIIHEMLEEVMPVRDRWKTLGETLAYFNIEFSVFDTLENLTYELLVDSNQVNVEDWSLLGIVDKASFLEKADKELFEACSSALSASL